MAYQEKQLAQSRENSTTAVSVYSPTSGTSIIKNIIVTNTSGAPADLRLFLDDDGTTYDESTVLAWDVTIAAGSIFTLDGHMGMNNTSGNLAYRSSVANALTITVFGVDGI